MINGIGFDTIAPDASRARLVETLHSSPSELLLGCSCGIAAAWTAALTTGLAPLTWLAVAVTVLALARLAVATLLEFRPQARNAGWLHGYYPAITFAYAAAIGLIAAIAMLQSAPVEVQLLALAYAIGHSTAISVRSAGYPQLALGQVAITLLPIFLTCLALARPPLLVLAAILPCLALAMANKTRRLFHAITERVEAAESSRQYAEELRRQALTDPVTGLANRSGMALDLEALAGTLPEREKLALLWLDLHRFKEINESLGHALGDKVLAEIGQRLLALAPERALVARFASDEFLLAAPLASREAAETLATAISEAVALPVRVAGNRIESGASIGVALMPDDGVGADRLMQSADLALYHAKAGGRNRIAFFTPAMTRALVRKKEIEAELRAAIQKDELSIFFQPIVDLETGRIHTFEALVRWFHPDKGELFPDEFIPVAEETGLIITLGNWITAQAARAASAWPEHVILAVNLSPMQIKAPGAALGILTALKEARLDPSRLELEVTENLFLDDDDHTARFMADLAREGVGFALDDFGTGYSSLHYINRYPFRTIKVDRSFVSGPNLGKRSDAIIRAVAEMGATLDMQIVAEGLETIDQVRVVREAGCTLGQGYYFSRAVPDYLAAMLLAQETDRTGAARLAG